MGRLQDIRDEAIRQEAYWRSRRVGFVRVALQECADADMTPTEAASYLGMTENALRCALHRHNVTLRRAARKPYILNPEIKILGTIKETAIANRGKASAAQIGEAIGVSRNSIIGHWNRARAAGEIAA